MIDRLFQAHPRSVGESYPQHLLAAGRFAGTLILAGLACLVHAILPSLFEKTGSRAIERLYQQMVLKRHHTPAV